MTLKRHVGGRIRAITLHLEGPLPLRVKMFVASKESDLHSCNFCRRVRANEADHAGGRRALIVLQGRKCRAHACQSSRKVEGLDLASDLVKA